MNCIATTCLSSHLLREALGVSFLEQQAKLMKEKHVACKLQPKLNLFKPGNTSDINLQITSLLKSWKFVHAGWQNFRYRHRTSVVEAPKPIHASPRQCIGREPPHFPLIKEVFVGFSSYHPLPGKFQRLRKRATVCLSHMEDVLFRKLGSLGGSDHAKVLNATIFEFIIAGPAPMVQLRCPKSKAETPRIKIERHPIRHQTW